MNPTTVPRIKSLDKYFCCFLFLSAVFFYFSSNHYFSVLIGNESREKELKKADIQLFNRIIAIKNISQNETDSRPLLVFETKISTHCFVTAFMDMKRDFWNGTLRRTNREYLSRFRRLIKLREPLVIFIDDTLLSEVNVIVSENRPPGIYTLIIPINRIFLYENIYAWGLVKREKEIMESLQFRSLLPAHLKHLPEHNVPEYTIMNHGKIDFVNYVISYIHSDQYERYSWIDFGYLHHNSLIPKNPFRTDLLSNNTITYMVLEQPDINDGDPMYSLLNPSEKITGGFFTGSKFWLKEYQKKYHEALLNYQSLNLSNDDQAIIPYIYYNYFSNFTFIKVATYKHGLLYVCDGITKRVPKG
jgi:hypothetical protein